MSHPFPFIPVLRPALTNRRSLHTVWRPLSHEDRGFFYALSRRGEPADYQPEGPKDWGNEVLSEADFAAPLYQ